MVKKRKRETRLIALAREEGKEIRKTFKTRLKEIEAKRVEEMNRKKEELAKKEAKRLKDAEDMTNDMCFYGLWQSANQVEEGMSRLPIKEHRKALESQLKFRKNVLKQKSTDTIIFYFSRKNETGKYIRLTTEQLKHNLLTLITDTLKEVTSEINQPDIPLFVDKTIEHEFSDGKKYIGKVISVVPGFPLWYNIKYEDDDAIYAYNIAEDYKSGDVKILVT